MVEIALGGLAEQEGCVAAGASIDKGQKRQERDIKGPKVFKAPKKRR